MDSFAVLKAACDLLKKTGSGDLGALSRVACLFGEALGAGSFSIHAIKLSPGRTSCLECIGCWIDTDYAEFGIEDYLSRLDLRKESSGYTIDIHDAAVSLPPSWCLHCKNLFLEGDIFGFFVYCIHGGVNDEAPYDSFLDAAAGIFELWIKKIDEQKRLEDILNYLPQPTFLMNVDEEITFWNPATETMTGWKAADIVGKPRYESGIPFYGERRPMVGNLIMNPDPRWEVLYHQFRSDEGGDVVYSLAFCKALYGVGAYLGTKTARLYDLSGRLCGSIHTVRDLTLERKMEKSLQRSESMYRAIADFAGMGIMLADENKIIYCNKQLKDFIGTYKDKNILKEDFISWVLPECRNIVRERLPVLSSGGEGPVRFEFKSKEGRAYRALAQRIEYEGKASVHWILDDITEQKLMAEKARLNELRLYHQDRLTALGTMAAGIAHELNQPLNTIRVITDGFLFGREEGWALDEDEFFESMEMVSRQVIRMTDVIQNIRDFSREDRAGLLSDVDANQAFKNVFSMIGRQLEAHGIDVQKDFDLELLPIRANLHRLEQVIMNLLVNARQALDQCEGYRKIIRVGTSAVNGRILMEVSDNAGGICAKIQDKIFQPFFTTKDAGMGTGLGLSICQSIIAEFNGYFEVYNNEMGGATFVVILPAGEKS